MSVTVYAWAWTERPSGGTYLPLRSLWWASRSNWGDSASHFFLIYHFLQQWNLPLCSDTSTGSITHSSDGLTARMSVCVCVCLAVLCVWICVGHLSAVRKGLDLCGCLCIKLPSHHTRRTQRPFCSKNVSQFPFARTWRDRCKRLEAASGIGGGDNVNLQECDPHHSDWFKRGAWRGERSPAALQQKKWNIIPVTIKPYLRDPFFFQPIAVVCQLPGRVMAAFSFAADLCWLTVFLRANQNRTWRFLSNTVGGERIGSKIKDQLIQIPVKTYYDLSLVRSRLVNDFSLTGLDSELSMSDTEGSQHLKDGTSKYIYDTSL